MLERYTASLRSQCWAKMLSTERANSVETRVFLPAPFCCESHSSPVQKELSCTALNLGIVAIKLQTRSAQATADVGIADNSRR